MILGDAARRRRPLPEARARVRARLGIGGRDARRCRSLALVQLQIGEADEAVDDL